ncbi:MAG TPA: caspase family protein [Kofleriaceae bacterium]|nr:caspase family protein [Kofleriaceae bacterium]
MRGPRCAALALIPLLAATHAAHADPVWLALTIGQEQGGRGDARLRYAERDARRMYDAFTTLGDVTESRAYLVVNASADAVRQALKEIQGRTRELVAAGREPILVVYYSGHADGQALRLGGTLLPHWELRALLAAIPARLRLLVIDACSSGSLIRVKGAAVEQPFALPVATIEGQVILTAAGPAEPAQEWDALGGGLFTHHLISGLRGAADRDGDGDVTLFEAYSYAYERTLAQSTRARVGPQHPGHEIDVRGTGDLVLTHPGRRGSSLVLARGLSGRYVVSTAEGGELVAEAEKPAGKQMRLALPPGRYVVRKPSGGFVMTGVVTLRPSVATELRDSSLERVPAFEVGGRGVGRPREHSLEATYSMASATVSGQDSTARVGAAFRRGRGPLELSIGGELSRSDLSGRLIAGQQDELWAEAGARWRYPIGWALPYAGVEVGAAYIRQRLRIAGPDETRNGLAFDALASLGAEFGVAPRLALRVEGLAGWVAPRLASGFELRQALLLRAALGWRW